MKMLIDVSGVFSSCDTLVTKVAFCWASLISPYTEDSTIVPPPATETNRITTMIQITSDDERALAEIESGRVRYAAASHRGSDSPISRATKGRRQLRAVASGGVARGAPFSSRRVRIRTGDQVDESTPAMRPRNSPDAISHPAILPSF